MLCSVVGWHKVVCKAFYVKIFEKGSGAHTQRKDGIVGRFMSEECIQACQNAYHMNNSTNAVFPFTLIFKGDEEGRGFFLHAYLD